jgi:hypothetical protein
MAVCLPCSVLYWQHEMICKSLWGICPEGFFHALEMGLCQENPSARAAIPAVRS